MRQIQRSLILLIGSFLLVSITSLAQNNDTIVLQLALHEFMATSLRMRNAVAEFEALNEGVQVQLVAYNQALERQSSNVDLDLWKSYLRQGDVVYIESGWFDAELTRTGYLLNLEPLYSTDSLGQETVFEHDSFVWDGGRWAFPVGIRPIMLSYDTEVFDAMGLSYPTENWTLSDIENWVNILSQNNDIAPILIQGDTFPTVMRHILGSSLYDPIINPIVPDFHINDIQVSMNTLQQLLATDAIEIKPIYVTDELPAIVISEFGRGIQPSSYQSISFGMSARGLSISSGTEHPELSYQLARFLAQNANVVSNFGGWAAYETVDDASVENFLGEMPFNLSDGINYPETFFTSYLRAIIESSTEPTLDDLQDAEIRAQENLISAEMRLSDNLSVNAPEIRESFGTGDVIRFGVYTNLSPLPTRTIWETIAEDFAEQSSDIAGIIIEPVFGVSSNLSQASQRYDCFYSPTNLISPTNLTNILPLTPLIDIDPNLNRDDFVGGTLAQVSYDNQIWAFPMDIKPFAMWISEDFIALSGLDLDNNMSLETFSALQQSHADDTPMIIPYNYDGMHLLLLIYALDGLPIDYRVDPPVINFTAPETINAVNTLVDMVENNILDYVSPISGSGSSGIAPIIIAPMDDANTRSGRLVFMSGSPNSTYNPYAFPYGRSLTPISYELGTAYISADTMLPEQCYQFLSYVSQEPYLFSSMSARLSTIERISQGDLRSPETTAFYQSFAQLAGRDDTIFIPPANGSEEYYRQSLFYRALDLIFLEDALPEDTLFQAQQYLEEYEVCLAAGDGSIEVLQDCIAPILSFFED